MPPSQNPEPKGTEHLALALFGRTETDRSKKRQPGGQLALAHADPAFPAVRDVVLEQVRAAEDELTYAYAQTHSFGARRRWGAEDLLGRARVRHAIVTGRTPGSVDLVMAYRHGWLEGIEDLAPPNPARTTPALSPEIQRAHTYMHENEETPDVDQI